MSYRRARTSEQKKDRVKVILNCAVEVYESLGYDGLNFSEISKRTDFTRTTIYKYFKTREELALLLCAHYVRNFVEDLHTNLPVTEQYTTAELTNIITSAVVKSFHMLHLLSLSLNRSDNVSAEIAAQFNKNIVSLRERLITLLKRIMPTVKEQETDNLLLYIMSSAIGLLSVTRPPNDTSIKEENLPEFSSVLREIIYRQIYCVKMNIHYS